jgi:hypothetical protein
MRVVRMRLGMEMIGGVYAGRGRWGGRYTRVWMFIYMT